MSILSSIFRANKYLKTSEGYRKTSEWTMAKDIELESGDNVENKLKNFLRVYENLSAKVSSFVADNTIDEYLYRGTILIDDSQKEKYGDITENDFCKLYIDPDQEIEISQRIKSFDGGIYVYVKEIPEIDIRFTALEAIRKEN